jgi:hypothetical protein
MRPAYAAFEKEIPMALPVPFSKSYSVTQIAVFAIRREG